MGKLKVFFLIFKLYSNMPVISVAIETSLYTPCEYDLDLNVYVLLNYILCK